MRRLHLVLGLAALAVVFATPGVCRAQQSVNFSLGGFAPLGEDARGRTNGQNGDVLLNNLDFLAFNIKDFTGGTASAEYLVGVGEYLDAGLGIGIYRRVVPSVYADLVNANGTEIEQSLRLRIVPFTATVRFLPLGRSAGVQPYIGAGAGVFGWRYAESGDFVDSFDNSVFRDRFVGSGSATGPVVLGGLRFPAGSWDFGGEVRYQRATGNLPLDQGFSADTIDLGGWTYAATFNVHF